jgi:glycosyltransferase involved in cell wall biosynthesis
MATLPAISVIVPNYNHGRYLRQRLDSILEQTYADFELILLDDASSDESREVIDAYAGHPRVTHVVYNPANSGCVFKQWNRGVALARGKFIWIAESDDYAAPVFLERTAAVLEKYPGVGLVFCDSYIVDEAGRELGNTMAWAMPHEPWGQLAAQPFVPGVAFGRDFLTARCAIPNASAVLFRKEVFLGAGGADESLAMTGDWKTWFSLAMRADVSYLADCLNYFRSHAQNVRTRKAGVLKREALQNLKLFYRQLRQRHAASRAVLDHHYEWAFRKAIWMGKRQYSAENFGAYFRKAPPQMVAYLLRHHLLEIISAKGRYWLARYAGLRR